MESREEFLESYGKDEQDVRRDKTGEYIVITAGGTHERIYLPEADDVDDELEELDNDYE